MIWHKTALYISGTSKSELVRKMWNIAYWPENQKFGNSDIATVQTSAYYGDYLKQDLTYVRS